MNVAIEKISDEPTLEQCAIMMSKSEPWITLQRNLEGCRDAMHGNYKEVYVARLDQELIGFIVLQMQGAFNGYIQSICVSASQRSGGVGTELIQFAEKRILTVSPNIFMLVSSFNTQAASLYSRLGYEKIGVLKNFVIDGCDELLLRKTVGSLKSFQSRKF